MGFRSGAKKLYRISKNTGITPGETAVPGVLGSVCRDRKGAFASAPTFIRKIAKESAV